jgi:hypothetical protein
MPPPRVSLVCPTSSVSAAGGRPPPHALLVVDTIGLPALLHEHVAAGLLNLLRESDLSWRRAPALAMAPHCHSHLPHVRSRLVTEEYRKKREVEWNGGTAPLTFFAQVAEVGIVLFTPVKSIYGVTFGTAGYSLKRPLPCGLGLLSLNPKYTGPTCHSSSCHLDPAIKT